jgi:hypothetical protein
MSILKSRSSKIIAALLGASALAAVAIYGPNLLVINALITEAPGGKIATIPAANLAAADQTMIDLSGHQVPVLKDGLYDKFRSNPPLSVVAGARPDVELS